MKKIIAFAAAVLLSLSTVHAESLLVKPEEQKAFLLNSYTSSANTVVIDTFEDGQVNGWKPVYGVGSIVVDAAIPILMTPAKEGGLYLIANGDTQHKAVEYVTIRKDFDTPMDLSQTPHFVFSLISYDIGGDLNDYRLKVTLYSGEKSMEVMLYPKIQPGDPWGDYVVDFSEFEGISAVDGISFARAVLNRGDLVWGDGKIALDRLEFTTRPNLDAYDVVLNDIQIFVEKEGPYYEYPADIDMDALAAERMANSVVMCIDSSVAYVNGEERAIDPDSSGVVPYLKNGRTLIPLRFMSEALGADVDWNSENDAVTILSGPKQINMRIGRYTYTVNDRELILDSVPEVHYDRSFVPIRAITDEMNKHIAYYDGLVVVCEKDGAWDEWYDGQIIEYIRDDLCR